MGGKSPTYQTSRASPKDSEHHSLSLQSVRHSTKFFISQAQIRSLPVAWPGPDRQCCGGGFCATSPGSRSTGSPCQTPPGMEAGPAALADAQGQALSPSPLAAANKPKAGSKYACQQRPARHERPCTRPWTAHPSVDNVTLCKSAILAKRPVQCPIFLSPQVVEKYTISTFQKLVAAMNFSSDCKNFTFSPALMATFETADGTASPSGHRSSDDWEMLGHSSPEPPRSHPCLHRPSIEIAFDADLQSLAASALQGTIKGSSAY